MTRTHFKRHDFRRESLSLTIDGLDKSIIELQKKVKEIDWYDGIWFLEEAEPIIGLSFIAFQNYANSSIYDKFETLEKKKNIYKRGNLIGKTGRTDIELIIGVANYFKHRDDSGDLNPGTEKILKDLNLQFEEDTDITDSPIFKGLELLSEKWKLTDVVELMRDWRENLWEEKK